MRPVSWLLALSAFVLVLAGLTLAGGPHEPRLGEDAAVRAALGNDVVGELLADRRWDSERVVALDGELTRVSLFDGDRIVANLALAPDGQVHGVRVFSHRGAMYGSGLAERLPLVALFSAVAALMLVTLPLRSARNADVVALLALAIPIVAGWHRLFELSIYAIYPPLAWLCARCAWYALTPQRPVREPRPTLYLWLTRTWPARARTRMLGIVGGAVAVATTLIAVTAPGAVDVGFASVQGATDLLAGRLPYGNIVDTVHGDTYPLLSYASYIPGALLMPVHDSFDDTTGALAVAALAALLTALALRRVAGGQAAIAWLCLPVVVVTASGGSNDLVLALLVAGAIAAVARRPAMAGAALAAGAWVKLAPFALIPAWLAALRAGDRRRALLAAGAVTALVAVWLVVLGGTTAIGEMVTGVGFQLRRGTLNSLWGLTGADPLQHAVQAAGAALAVLLVARARREPGLGRDPLWVAQAGGALLLALQLGSTNLLPTYATWALPAVLVALHATPRRDAVRVRPPRPESGRYALQIASRASRASSELRPSSPAIAATSRR